VGEQKANMIRWSACGAPDVHRIAVSPDQMLKKRRLKQLLT
jgi:hypothetical protein